jgi:hypothetical protein
MAHLNAPAPDLADLDADLPPEVVAATRAALDKDPASRPSASDLAARLRRSATASAPPTQAMPVTRTEPVPPGPVGPAPRRATERPSRGPLVAVLVLLAGLALAALLFALASGDGDDRTETVDTAPATTAAPTTAAPVPPPTAAPTTEAPASTTTAAPGPASAGSGAMTDAAVTYIETLAAGDLDAAWQLTTPRFQAQQDRASWESFWTGFDSIEIVGEPRGDEGSGTVVLPISFDGGAEDYTLNLVEQGGGWLVDGPVGG